MVQLSDSIKKFSKEELVHVKHLIRLFFFKMVRNIFMIHLMPKILNYSLYEFYIFNRNQILNHLINFEIYKDIDPPINAPKTKY